LGREVEAGTMKQIGIVAHEYEDRTSLQVMSRINTGSRVRKCERGVNNGKIGQCEM
jgi:hypothetical protein